MIRRDRVPISCFLIASTAGLIAGAPGPTAARVPKGIYTNFLLDGAVNRARIAAYPKINLPKNLPAYPNPQLTPDPTDSVLVSYFTTLLNNPAISGLAPMIPWNLLNPNSPGANPVHPAAGAYTWNALDDVFIAVDRWNSTHRLLPPKTIQLIVSSGFNSPGWVFSDIDAGVCGSSGGCTGSCDALFMNPPPTQPASTLCGYTTLFYQVESGTPVQIPLPLPWSAVYKSDWGAFLAALNQHIQQEPSSSAFVSIAMSGPTASSTEMILPNQDNQTVNGNGGILTLGAGVLPASDTIPNLDVPSCVESSVSRISMVPIRNSKIPICRSSKSGTR